MRRSISLCNNRHDISGAMAVKGASVFAQTCVSALPHLAEMIADKEARSTEEHSVATENAIAAVAKILKFCGGLVPIDHSVSAREREREM